MMNYRFSPTLPMTLLAFFVCTVLLYLGNWQLARAREKTQWLAAHEQAARLPARPWTHGISGVLPYQKLRVRGIFREGLFLLDNQHVNHQFGYDVLNVLEVADGHWLLVDRGWIPGDPARQVLPSVNTPQSMQELEGYAYYPSEKGWLLGAMIEPKNTGVTMLEQSRLPVLAAWLHHPLEGFILRLDPKTPHGFVRQWPVVAMQPVRHKGYAVQWFAMAGAVFILFIVLNLKPRHTVG